MNHWWKFYSDQTRIKSLLKRLKDIGHGLWKTISKHLKAIWIHNARIYYLKNDKCNRERISLGVIYISDIHTNSKSNNLLIMLQYLHPSLFIHEANCEFLVKALRYVAMAKAIPILNSSGKRWTSKLTSCYATICTSLLLSSSIKNSYL